ncbi:MAG: hypothetical protein ACP5PT_08205 [Brevinematia bacterium]
MDETEVFKKALKTAFIKEILPQQLVDKKIINERDLNINEQGKIKFSSYTIFETSHGQETIENLVTYLASELADVKVELWLKEQSNKKG